MSRIPSGTLLALVFCVGVVACGEIGLGTGTDAGTPPPPATDSGTSAAADAQGGTGCMTDTTTGVTLCTGLSECPDIIVDQGAYPGCGFREGGASVFDLECLCAGSELCPVGVPTGCASALQLLTQEQSALQVCQQVNSGGCISLLDGGSGSGGGSGGGSTTLSAACSTCVQGCGGTPACYQACGC